MKELNEAYEKSPFIFIEGGGGIGKTQLVAKFIDGLSIKDSIVWYDCIPTSQPDDLIKGAGFEELLKGKEKTEREKFSAFKDKIEENDLVVFLDNYQEVKNTLSFKSFLAFINDYLRKGHLIVLCRDNIISTNLQAKRISVKGLGEDSLTHAQKLIENSYKDLIDTSKEDLALICNKLKGYPLAIDLAVYLLSLKVSVQNIINVTIKEAQEVGSDIEKDCKRLLNEIFTRPDASEDERSFLKLFSIFRGKTKDADVISVIPDTIYESAKRKLINRNLLEINNDYLELHPLIREFCYSQLDNKKELHHTVANYFIEKRFTKWNPELEEKIFYHLSCAEQWQDISNTIIQSGRKFILHGYLDRLQQMINRVKDQNVFDPKFDIYEGDIAEIKGDWDFALSIFEKTKQSVNSEVKIEGLIKYGEMLYRQDNVKEAELIFKDAIEITNNDDYKKSHARALNDLGLVDDFFGNTKEALIKYDVALKIRQELNDQEDIAISLNNIGSLKSNLGLNKEALDLHKKSLKIREEIGDKSGIANSLNSIGIIKSDLGFIKEALDLYEKSLKISKEIGDKSGIADSFNNIGSIKSDLGLKKESLDLYEKSLKISEEIGDKSGIVGNLINIGAIKFDLGFKKEALDLYEKSLIISEEIGDKSGIAYNLIHIGNVKSDLGLKKEALDLYEESLIIREEIGDKSGIATSLNNIGTLKNKNEALDLYEKSLKIREEIGNKSGIASNLNNIGSIKSDLGLKNEALVLFEKSLEIFEEIGTKPNIATCLSNISVFLFENNRDLEKAWFYLLKSIAMNEQMGIPDNKQAEFYLFQMRKKGAAKFEEMLNDGFQKLDDDLKPFIDLNKVLGKPVKVEKTPGRNDSCNCGSGKKYKNCHGKIGN